MNDLSQSELASLLFYGAIALWLAVAIPRLFRGRLLAGLVALAFWVAAFLAVVTGYAYRHELNAVAARVIATVIPGVPIPAGKDVTFIRASDGEFVVRGLAGQARLQFIFDTGASAVVLRAEDAVRAGIKTKQLAYTMEVATANGRALAAAATLPSLAIGDIVERNIDVLVAKPGALHENLLGMTFLNRLASFTIENDKLLLRGR